MFPVIFLCGVFYMSIRGGFRIDMGGPTNDGEIGSEEKI